MSLELVLNQKGQGAKRELLSVYLKNNFGDLSEPEITHFRHIFAQYYTPDPQHVKFNSSDISHVTIKKSHNNPTVCFHICVDNEWYETGVPRLAGGNRTENANLKRALRNAINPQIQNYRQANPLNPNNICPITKGKLGIDAQVDHVIPFYKLADEWLANNKNVSYTNTKDGYILNEPYLTSWYNFHLEKAVLRYLSKEGNKTAHRSSE